MFEHSNSKTKNPMLLIIATKYVTLRRITTRISIRR